MSQKNKAEQSVILDENITASQEESQEESQQVPDTEEQVETLEESEAQVLEEEEVEVLEENQVEVELEELTDNYLRHFIEAVNKGKPEIVFPYLTNSGPLYTDQAKYIPYFHNKGIREEMVAYEIIEITQSSDYEYQVEVLETLYIVNNNEGKVRKFSSVYTALKVDNRFLFHELEQEELFN